MLECKFTKQKIIKTYEERKALLNVVLSEITADVSLCLSLTSNTFAAVANVIRL